MQHLIYDNSFMDIIEPRVEPASCQIAGGLAVVVVLDIAVGEGGRLKAVAVFGFGFGGGGDKAAFEIGVLPHTHPIAAIAGKKAALFCH